MASFLYYLDLLAVCPGDGLLKIVNTASEVSVTANVYINYHSKVMSVSAHVNFLFV